MKKYTCKLYENGKEIKSHSEPINFMPYDEWFYSTGLNALKPNGRLVLHFIDESQVYVDGTPMRGEDKGVE